MAVGRINFPARAANGTYLAQPLAIPVYHRYTILACLRHEDLASVRCR